ncbi:MAG: hypothetical protein KF902_05405 [Phycisphaeraceae bacterium]|nr:hypothetical protein [Phycisphaeraceae bacterium]MCW5768268.1 hypothetical protein [Phycisphaeraceae bacterium]
MRLMVDDAQVALERPTLAAAIAAGAAHADSLGRIVVEVRADGVTLAERDIESAPDVPGTFEEVSLLTASKGELGASVLMAASGALSDLVSAQRFVAEQILATKLEPAMNALQEVLSVWQGVREGTDQVCTLMASDFGSLAARAGRPGVESGIAERTASALTEVKRCVQGHDWSTLADVMQDELESLALAWRDLLAAIAESLAEGE